MLIVEKGQAYFSKFVPKNILAATSEAISFVQTENLELSIQRFEYFSPSGRMLTQG